jgi:uncharacterized protein (TIGR03083 family)
VQHREFIARFELDSTGVAQAAEGHLSSAVSACPGWDVGDVVGHLGGVYSWAAGAVRGGGERPPGRESPPGDRSELLGWFGQQRAELLRAFADHGESDHSWVFMSSSPQVVGWWARRQTFESTIHRFDVEAATGCAPTPLDPLVSVEGVDEYLTQFLPRVLSHNPVDALHGTFHAHATDAEGEWSLDFATPGLTRREHSKADTAIRGPAGGLFLWMWNRLTPEQAGLTTFGDESVIEAFDQVRL